jgi:nucleotide-binding universal stress UspA family protein
MSAALSAPLQGALHLMQVVRLPIDYEYGQVDSVARARQKALSEAHAYLRMVKQRLRKGSQAHLKPQAGSSVAVNKDVAEALIRTAELGEEREDVKGFDGCDVIALATHGRSGLERLIRGSVTERILGTTRLPLLIVRPASTRGDISSKKEAPQEGKTSGTQDSETEGPAAQMPFWTGLL